MQEPINSTTDQAQTSIFPQEIDFSESDKKIKNARGVLYWLAIVQFGMGIYEYYSADDKLVGSIAFGIDAFVAAIFLGLALYTRKKPYISLLLALIAYIMVVIASVAIDPANLASGVIVKIFFTVALVKGLRAAREAEALKKMAGIE